MILILIYLFLIYFIFKLYIIVLNISFILQLPHIGSENFQAKFGSGVKTPDTHMYLECIEIFYYTMGLWGRVG